MLARIASCAFAALALVGTAHAGSGWSNTFPPGNGLNGTVRALLAFDDGSGPALFAGGDFTTAGGIPANHIAKWDGDSWSALGLGVDGPVHALAAFDDGTGPALHVGGDFIHAGGGAANRIAKWDGSNWFHLGSWTDEVVRALAVAEVGAGAPKLYAGGPAGVARWTGTSWSPLPGLQIISDGVSALAGVNGALFASSYLMAPGSISKWNGTSWSAAGPAVLEATTLAVIGAGGPTLYAGGGFGGSDGGVAQWTGSSWQPLGATNLYMVRTLAAHDDGQGVSLYAGGEFSAPYNRLARWDGSTWSSLGSGVGGGFVYAMTTFDDGTGAALYVAGNFTNAGGQPADRIARWCCAPPASVPFCLGTESVCPCDGGAPGAGCQTASGSGGVTLSVLSQSTQPNGAILVGQGYPSMGAPTAVVIRSPALDPASPVIFGDGVRCVSPTGLVRLAASVAVGGVSTHVIGHNSAVGPGTFYYQLWFRDTPSTYCDPSTAFNLSSGRTLVW